MFIPNYVFVGCQYQGIKDEGSTADINHWYYGVDWLGVNVSYMLKIILVWDRRKTSENELLDVIMLRSIVSAISITINIAIRVEVDMLMLILSKAFGLVVVVEWRVW